MHENMEDPLKDIFLSGVSGLIFKWTIKNIPCTVPFAFFGICLFIHMSGDHKYLLKLVETFMTAREG